MSGGILRHGTLCFLRCLLLCGHVFGRTNSPRHHRSGIGRADRGQALFDRPAAAQQPLSFRNVLRRTRKSTDRREEVLKTLQLVQQDATSVCKNENRSVVLDIAFDDHSRSWKTEALLAVEVANLMTSLWRIKKTNGRPQAENDELLYQLVRSNVRFSPSIFGSVICFERNRYHNYERFCPYAYRDENLGWNIHVIDLSVEIDYLTSSETIWWRESREKALNLTLTETTEYYSLRMNATHAEALQNTSSPEVRYEDGSWTRPYFDCFGGKIWMITYLAPFFDETSSFLGVVSIDIALSGVDINQCDDDLSGGPDQSEPKDKNDSTDGVKLMEFLRTHRCKESTVCEPIPNQGFKRGSYVCKCKPGYYFPETGAAIKSFNGSDIEAEYDKQLRGEPSAYSHKFGCLKCSEGCATCDSERPCVYTAHRVLLIVLLAVDACMMVLTVAFGIIVYIHRDNKIFYSASILFLELALFGAFLMYIAFVLCFPKQTDRICISRVWFIQCGFVLMYGSLALKTWRLKSSFRARSARRVEVTEVMMVRRLVVIITLFVIFLLIWTLTDPPHIVSTTTWDKLDYYSCATNSVWNYVIIGGDLFLLVCAMYLCFRSRKAPSAYNESKFVTLAIYNAMFVTVFIAVLRYLTADTSNSDILFATEFVLVQMSASTTISLVFIPKFYCLWKLHSRGVNKALTLSRRGSSTNTNDESCTNDSQALEKENDDLKAEVKRLATRVAVLQSTLMKERNKHLKSNSSQRVCAYSNTSDEREMGRATMSPVTRLME